MKHTNKKGFTIVELVIVIAVIAILAAVLIPTFSNLIKKANESSDIQAVREMNTFLTAEAILNGVDSILDVYDIFEASGFKVENFSPLVSGNEFYYDVELNQILYVDAEGKVLFPKEYKGQTKAELGHNWLSLDMSIGTELPTEFAVANNVMTAKVTNAKQYAYVIEQYNNAAEGTALNLTIDGTLDLQSATTVINETKGAVTITGTNNAVIKNITSNKFSTVSTNNSSGIAANYKAAALIASAKHNVTITNVTFENLNVRVIDAGNVGLICGETTANVSITLGNVTIKNSSVIGQRSVGAILGAAPGSSAPYPIVIKGNVTFDNVYVGSVGGRSAFLATFNTGSKIQFIEGATIDSIVINDNCKLELYANAASEQQTITEADLDKPNDRMKDVNGNVVGTFIKSAKTFNEDGTIKQYSSYGFDAEALIIVNMEYKNTNGDVVNKANDGYTSLRTLEEVAKIAEIVPVTPAN